mgnify:CR=1 FL=1
MHYDTPSFLCRFRRLIGVWVTQILEYKHLLLGRKPAMIVRKIAGFCQQCCQFCTSFDAALQTSHCIFGSSATGEIHLRQFRKGRSRFCHLLSFRLMLSIVRYANIRNQDTLCQVFRALIMKFLLESFPLYIPLVVCGGNFLITSSVEFKGTKLISPEKKWHKGPFPCPICRSLP